MLIREIARMFTLQRIALAGIDYSLSVSYGVNYGFIIDPMFPLAAVGLLPFVTYYVYFDNALRNKSPYINEQSIIL